MRDLEALLLMPRLGIVVGHGTPRADGGRDDLTILGIGDMQAVDD
jgi:hypothetical protein